MGNKNTNTDYPEPGAEQSAKANTNPGKVKFEVYGEEMIEKEVKLSGNSGRIYLPPIWVGHRVKIIKID
ncbi:MAG: DUF2080 family transposase-associated protein [Desulfocapsaceae bacterium]|nr:DUF2080 family transposase-associated protein [Desulfocapsaceae bacterium]